MINLVDSCGWLEYFANGQNADFFAPLIEDTENLVVPVICVYEVFKRIYQQKNEDIALQCISQMNKAEIIPLDEPCALYAAKYSIEYKLPMADSIILAVSKIKKATLWTQDIDFKGIPEVKYIEKKKKSNLKHGG